MAKEKIAKESSSPKLKEYYDKLNELLHEDTPCIFLWQEESLLAYNARFQHVITSTSYGIYPGYYLPMFWTPKDKVKYKY